MEKTYGENALRDNFHAYVFIQIFTIRRRVLVMGSRVKLLLRGSEKISQAEMKTVYRHIFFLFAILNLFYSLMF